MNSFERSLGYSFADRTMLIRALTHSSFANENRNKGLESNERLEFLGDSVLGMVVAEALFVRCPDLPEGKMTRLRAQLVCEESLHKAAVELKLGEHMRLGKGEELSGGRTRVSILADAVEAVIAAMYLDGGFDVAKAFIERYILSALQDAFERVTDNKTELQELVQRKSGQVLCYVPAGESGPDHDKTFTFRVVLNGETIGEGSGRTKKEAEQAAACAALRMLDE